MTGLSRSFLLRSRRVSAADSYRHHGLVVKRLSPGRVFGDGLENPLHDTVRGTVGAFGNYFFHASPAEHFSLAVAGIENAIAKHHEHIAGLHLELKLIVFGLVEQTQRQPGGFDDLVLAAMNIDGAGQTRI